MQLDFEKTLEMLFREFDKNPPLWIGVASLLVALLAFLVFHLLFTGRKKKDPEKGRSAISGTPAADAENKKPGLSDLVENLDREDEAVPAMDDTPAPGATMAEAGPDDDSRLLEELSIPRPGAVPSPPGTAASPDADHQTPGNANPAEKAKLSDGELIEIERKLVALRELHDAGLIATEIYLLKSRELSKDI